MSAVAGGQQARPAGDVALATVLNGKPLHDEVPHAAWWYVAESLRHSVHVRRSVDGVAILDEEALAQRVNQGLEPPSRHSTPSAYTQDPDRATASKKLSAARQCGPPWST